MEILFPRGPRYNPSVSDKVPPHYHQYAIPGATARYVSDSFGDFLCQRLAEKDFSLQLNNLSVTTKQFGLLARNEKPLISLHFMLIGSPRCRLKGFGKVFLLENRYHLFYIPPGVAHPLSFGKGKYLSLHIDLSPAFLRRSASIYPSLQGLLQSVRQGSQIGVQHYAAPIRRRVRTLVEEILSCRKQGPERSLYFESRIIELLRLYVKDMDALPEDAHQFSRQEQILQAVREYIQNNLEKDLAIPLLSKRFLISERSLRRGFKKLFGITIHRYIQAERMAKARQLLSETEMSIGEVAERSGFPGLSYFDKVFKQFYGRSPLAFREDPRTPQK